MTTQTQIKVTVRASQYMDKLPDRALPLKHVAQAVEKLYGPNWKQRLSK